jgi:hypothetical protein
MQTAQGCADAMRQGRLVGKSSGIIRPSVRLCSVFYLESLTCDWEMSALTKSISVGGFKPPSPPVHVHSCRFPNPDIFVRLWNARIMLPCTVHLFRSCVRTSTVSGRQPKHSDRQLEGPGLSLRMGGSISKSTQGLYQAPIKDIHVGGILYHEPRYKFSNVSLNFSSATAFSSSIPTVMRRHPWC